MKACVCELALACCGGNGHDTTVTHDEDDPPICATYEPMTHGCGTCGHDLACHVRADRMRVIAAGQTNLFGEEL